LKAKPSQTDKVRLSAEKTLSRAERAWFLCRVEESEARIGAGFSRWENSTCFRGTLPDHMILYHHEIQIVSIYYNPLEQNCKGSGIMVIFPL